MTDLPAGPRPTTADAPNGPAPDATSSKETRATTTGDGDGNGDGADDGGSRAGDARRRGSRGGRNRSRPRPKGAAGGLTADAGVRNPSATDPPTPSCPTSLGGEPVSVEAADASLVRRPAATAPAPDVPGAAPDAGPEARKPGSATRCRPPLRQRRRPRPEGTARAAPSASAGAAVEAGAVGAARAARTVATRAAANRACSRAGGVRVVSRAAAVRAAGGAARRSRPSCPPGAWTSTTTCWRPGGAGSATAVPSGAT